MLPPWAHQGYDGDSAAAGEAAPSAIAVPNMTSVRVAWTMCLTDMTRPSLLTNLRQHSAGASAGYEMGIGHRHLKFLLKRRSVTQVTLAGFGSDRWSFRLSRSGRAVGTRRRRTSEGLSAGPSRGPHLIALRAICHLPQGARQSVP